MPNFSSSLAPIILAFQSLMLNRTWQHAMVLLAGAILAPGKRTVCSVLRIVGRRQHGDFQNYHRVLNRASWSLRCGSRILLGLLVQQFAPDGPLVFGIDDTIERRWGPKIQARGIYRDPVRSSRTHVVKASGLRWLSLMLLVPIPWAHRVWALPFLTCLAASERYYSAKKRKAKTLLDWARQQAFQLRRWLPNRQLILVADGAFAALEFLDQLRTASIVCITRLRLDARLFEPAPARAKGRPGRPRIKGHRLPSLQQRLLDRKTRWKRHLALNWYGRSERRIEFCSGTAIWYHGGLPPASLRWVLIRDPEKRFEPLALLSTDQTADPLEIIGCYLRRWQVEVTFEESRAHLGIETQRQWSEKAIARTTPLLLALFSIVTLMASRLATEDQLPIRQSSWYSKAYATFSDALAVVRKDLWAHGDFFTSSLKDNPDKFQAELFERFSEALCYAA
jgi:hypothetical protein